MTNREIFVAALAQTLAPKLYELCDDKEVGFPFGETPADVENKINKMSDPVAYWTDKATEIAEGLAAVFEAGGIDLSVFDYDASVSAALAMREDVTSDPTHPQHAEMSAK